MILDYSETPLKRRFKAVLTKPHQPFFLLGIVIALYSIAVLGFALKGQIAIDIKTFHVFNMAILMSCSLFLGFLTTVLYRFLLVARFSKEEYMRIFWTLLAGVLILEIGFFASDILVLIGMLSVLTAQALSMRMFIRAYRSSTALDKRDVFWILYSFGFGTLSAAFFAASIFYPSLQALAVNLAFYPFTVGVVFAVAQRMVPAFFVLYFGVMEPQKNSKPLPTILLSLLAIAVFRSFYSPVLLLLANIVGLAATVVLFLNNSFIFRKAPPVLWILQAGALWFFAGFAVGTVESGAGLLGAGAIPSLLQVHIWGVGFVTTMLIGFGSRVAMGHSGRKIAADRLTITLFVFVIVLTFVRLLGVFLPQFLMVSVYLWCVLFIVWIYRYAPMLVSD